MIGLVLWAAALWGVAQCRHVFGGHSFCGPWGCGSSAGALLGAHGLWVVVLVPAAAIAGARLPRNWAVRLGAFLIAAGAVGTAAHLAWDLRTWLAATPDEARPFAANRVLFTAINQTDVPLLPAVAAGPAAWAGARWADRRAAHRSGPPSAGV